MAIRKTEDGQWEVYHTTDVRDAKGPESYWQAAKLKKQADIDAVPQKRASAHATADLTWDTYLTMYSEEMAIIDSVIALIESEVSRATTDGSERPV